VSVNELIQRVTVA